MQQGGDRAAQDTPGRDFCRSGDRRMRAMTSNEAEGITGGRDIARERLMNEETEGMSLRTIRERS